MLASYRYARLADQAVYLKKGEEKAIVEADEFPSLPALAKELPRHCFAPSLPRSLYYVGRDLVVVALLFAAMLVWGSSLPSPAKELAWVVYWFLQGTMFWALFVLGHDCGHQSFSRYKPINFFVGNLLHGFLLVPYQSWALSHRHHHQNTGNYERDEPFVPELQAYPLGKLPPNSGMHKFRRLAGVFLGALWLLYLAGFSRCLTSHFWPWDPMFKGQRVKVILSIATVAAVAALLGTAAHRFGMAAVMAYYGLPILVFSSWLVVTTFLHHNHPDVPWYARHNWTFVKGNVSTIDRSYGFFNRLVHDIGTHQIHHLFISIPHYYLTEATRHFRGSFPHLARYSYTPIISSYVSSLGDYGLHGYLPEKLAEFTYREVMAQRRTKDEEDAAPSSGLVTPPPL